MEIFSEQFRNNCIKLADMFSSTCRNFERGRRSAIMSPRDDLNFHDTIVVVQTMVDASKKILTVIEQDLEKISHVLSIMVAIENNEQAPPISNPESSPSSPSAEFVEEHLAAIDAPGSETEGDVLVIDMQNAAMENERMLNEDFDQLNPASPDIVLGNYNYCQLFCHVF